MNFFILIPHAQAISATSMCGVYYLDNKNTIKHSERFSLGTYRSRAIWRRSSREERKPVVIMIPGSGAHGPRELIPGSFTVDGKDAPLFDQLASAFNDAEVSTLQLGKPGIEDQIKFDLNSLFYDKMLFENLHWTDLLKNLDEAVNFVTKQPNVDPSRIYILGHSEGTQLAVDYASSSKNVAGVILLGYAGEDLSTIVDWQLFRRPIDSFISYSVDSDKDGFISKQEASKWPEFQWVWVEGQDKISYAEIENALRNNYENIKALNNYQNFPLWADGIWNRGSIYEKTATLTQDVYIFTGELDEQTSPQQSLNALKQFEKFGKKNAFVTIVPDLGHGFSSPRPPRRHPFLDMTVGPIANSFLDQLTNLAKTF